ncbi:NUDIX domain-containing protein [Agrobacterium sp. SHOUNA12C]|uniref:Hydrolase n=1 Tax=Rhizobium rhizogenes NBRC 13257 TaxID=1220581 RepID=A0AA87PW45_RHIRH|nr:NUDIX domain-containing protein [Rhizobium rhizogenes]KAA6489722.1 NUDIX domain-containing protein [Agrobacterium sp. ICMP 7243]MCJ9721622.1 NUDIX domain-containing protein [Agrobacterium sp. BETTINA12B]MCJ9756402.1 NUDIX domain-containing protein [Agrobacterium sp. SHOUNA12C]OCJ05995.1 DNA mismatch repair protein MutT [Agrobacterium sp. 13-626]OCJ25796.1 DNA mismatch repair protein MutT [Agrobacterium sp. B131/95]OCJ31103.1 DNA mismatch repair protein MutT [Agrobacterium sp. B133/95]
MGKPGIDFPGLGTGLAILRDRKLLLYKRLKAPEAGFWSIVGGKVDHMEPAAKAAIREAEEESGLSIGNIDYLCATEVINDTDRQHWISLIYLTKDFSGEASLVEPDKLSDFGWFGRNELPQPLSAFAEATIAHLSKDDF